MRESLFDLFLRTISREIPGNFGSRYKTIRHIKYTPLQNEPGIRSEEKKTRRKINKTKTQKRKKRRGY